ncbi:MAG TPA: methyltransferase domain-containing protein [Solirubrobacterales bacterium]|nr:methyltransferase domain-containing protein [Solirubrobacterales bacterium]
MSDQPPLLNEVDTYGPAYMRVAERLGRYDASEEEAPLAIELLGLRPGDRVLDAGCGLGRFVAALAAQGIDAWGVDISEIAIAEAKRAYPGPTYLVADLMKPLPDELRGFDGLVSLSSSFGFGATVGEDEAMLRAYHEALRPGGRMAMELSDLERSRHRLKTDEGVVERETNGVQETLDVDFSTGMLHVHYVCGEDVVDSRIRMYEADDLQRMAEAAGFREVERYGNFAGGPKRPEDRLVLVATAA